MSITLDIKVGDTVLFGKWKNKRVEVKSIGVDDHGLPTINGTGILKIRIPKVDPLVKKESIRDFVED